jgi:hypothetical protein
MSIVDALPPVVNVRFAAVSGAGFALGKRLCALPPLAQSSIYPIGHCHDDQPTDANGSQEGEHKSAEQSEFDVLRL